MLQRLGLKEGEAIVHPWINKALEKAQKKVEARNFDTRKNVLKYDDVMNDQRREVYAQRREFMKATDVSETVADMRAEMIARDGGARAFPRRRSPSSGNWPSSPRTCGACSTSTCRSRSGAREEGIDETQHPRAHRAARRTSMMAAKAANIGPDLMRFIEKSLLLQMLDAVWKEHLLRARPSAPGHRPARLRPARPAERIQERGVRAVQRHAGRAEGAGDGDAGPRRDRRPSSRRQPPPPLPMQMVESHPDPATAARRCRAEPAKWPARRRRSARCGAVGDAAGAQRAVDPNDPATWRSTPAQRAVPVRLGEEVQALPRPGDVAGAAAVSR